MGNLEQAMRENKEKESKGFFERLVEYGEHVKAIEKYNKEWDKIREEQDK